MKPLFAKGVSGQHIVSQSIAHDTNLIYITNANAYYSAGDEIFISESNGLSLEYLGQATSVDSTKIITTFNVSEGKSSSAIVWKPTDLLKFYVSPSSPKDRKYYSGIDVVRTEGGVSYSSKISDSYEITTLTFENYPRDNFAEIESWLKDTLNDFLEEFSYIDEQRQVCVVRILDNTVGHFEKNIKNVDFKINLEIIEKDEYI